MHIDLAKARQELDSSAYTCVVCKGNTVYTATERGVKPLLSWLDSGTDLQDFCAADKVVGKATAYLYCLLGVYAVYAHVMSRPAAQVLKENGIRAYWGSLVDGIINRKGTGPCPFEEAVMDIHSPDSALDAIRAKAAQMGI